MAWRQQKLEGTWSYNVAAQRGLGSLGVPWELMTQLMTQGVLGKSG